MAAPAHLSQPGCLEWEYNVQLRELLHRQRCRLTALRRSHLLQSTALAAFQQSVYLKGVAKRDTAALLRGTEHSTEQQEAQVELLLPKAPPAHAVPHAQSIAVVYAPPPPTGEAGAQPPSPTPQQGLE